MPIYMLDANGNTNSGSNIKIHETLYKNRNINNCIINIETKMQSDAACQIEEQQLAWLAYNPTGHLILQF